MVAPPSNVTLPHSPPMASSESLHAVACRLVTLRHTKNISVKLTSTVSTGMEPQRSARRKERSGTFPLILTSSARSLRSVQSLPLWDCGFPCITLPPAPSLAIDVVETPSIVTLITECFPTVSRCPRCRYCRLQGASIDHHTQVFHATMFGNLLLD
jgi:hypothetical protein